MKTKVALLTLIAAAVVVAPAVAFHDGGVAHCNGCHTMHNSEDGVGVNDDGSGTGGEDVGTGYDDLLLFPNATDVCTDCHGNSGRSYAVWSADPDTITKFESAGDFVFLLDDNLNDGHRGSVMSNWIPGEAGAHNVKSGIKGTNWDSTLSAPPAVPGASPLSNNNLHCSSCHDPHGNDGFRLLYQAGQDVSVGGDLVTYGTSMVAYGISYGDDETNDNHNAYASGYSEWCSTCHTGFHNGYGNMIHPSGTALTGAIVTKYNKYEGTTDCVNNAGSPCGTGLSADAYLAEVPYEDPAHTIADVTKTAGPTGTSKVACVSCHRAHGSSAPDIGRWDFNVTLLIEDGDQSGSWEIPNPYDDNQRSLCNKCHAQDEYDHLPTP